MKLARLEFDCTVCIPMGKETGANTRQDLRESTFAESDGWDLRELATGVFRLHREGMPTAAVVGGYGYAYTSVPEPAVETKGKRK